MIELTRVPEDRRAYRLAGFGVVRSESWFGRTASAEADDGRTWRFTRRGFWGRVIEATDATGAAAGTFTPRDIRRGGKLRWGQRNLELHPIGLRERYALNEDDRDLALLDAKGWGKRPVKITLAAERAEIEPGLLLFAAFVVQQLASDSAGAASAGSAAVMSAGS